MEGAGASINPHLKQHLLHANIYTHHNHTIEEHSEILMSNTNFIYIHTRNVAELQKSFLQKGIIKESDLHGHGQGLFDCKIYNIVSLIIKRDYETYKKFLECLRLTENEHVADRLEKTILPDKKDISVQRNNTETGTPIKKHHILELTDILTDSIIPYEEIESILFEQHIEPEIYLHKKLTQKTDKSEHWRLRKILKLWVSTYQGLATFEFVIKQLGKPLKLHISDTVLDQDILDSDNLNLETQNEGQYLYRFFQDIWVRIVQWQRQKANLSAMTHDSRQRKHTIDKINKLLSDIKKENNVEKISYTGLTGLGRRPSCIEFQTDPGLAFEEAGKILKTVIKKKSSNGDNKDEKQEMRKIVQFALSLGKVKNKDGLDNLACAYSKQSSGFKILATVCTLWDVFFDIKFIYDCFNNGQTSWGVLSCTHFITSMVFFTYISNRYRVKSEEIRTLLGYSEPNDDKFPRKLSLLNNTDEGVLTESYDLEANTVNNPASVSFLPISKLFVYQILCFFPLCPSAILHLFWIWTYYFKLESRRKSAYINTEDNVLTIHGNLIYLFYNSSHAGKMARYEYLLETLPQVILRTVYFLSVLMESGKNETDFLSCFGLAVQILSLGVTLTLFKVAHIQYCHFEDQRTFQLALEWKKQACWMLSSGLSTGAIVLAISMLCKMVFDSLSLFEWSLIFLAVFFYLITFFIIKRPDCHTKMFKNTLHYWLSKTSEFLSPIHLYPHSVSHHFLNRCAFLLTLLVVSVLTGPTDKEDKYLSYVFLIISLCMFILGGVVQWWERPWLPKHQNENKIKNM